MPAAELATYERNIAYARTMAGTAAALQAQVTGAIDPSDLFRAALVQGVSAFDHYVHEEVRTRMLLIHQQPRATWPDPFSRFRVAMTSVVDARHSKVDTWLDNEIRAQHGHLSFQQPDKVADAIRLVSGVELWNTLAATIGQPPIGLKTRLKLIVDRRNTIAHEADTDPTPPRTRYPITREMVDESLDFLDVLVHAMAVTI